MTSLPATWCQTTIREVVEPYNSIDPARQPNRIFRYIDIGSIDNIIQEISAPKTVSGREAPSRARRVVRTGDTLFSTVRTYLKNVALVPSELDGELTSTGIAVLRPSPAVEPNYLFAVARSDAFISTVSVAQDGTMYPAVSDADVMSAPIALPPLSEQRRIVAKIDSLSAKSKRARNQLDHVPRLVERYKQAVLDASVGIPTRTASLIDFVERQRGIPYGIVQTGTEMLDGVPTVRCGDIKDFKVSRIALKRVEREIEANYTRTRLRGGEVLIAIRGSVGNTCVASPDLRGCNISREVAMIPLAEGHVPKFFAYYLTSTMARSFIMGNVRGVAQQGINLADLRNVPVPLLEFSEQRGIVRRIEAAFAWIDRLAAEASSARNLIDRLAQAVLAKAFQGELVSQDSNDEPASVLLKQIKTEGSGSTTAGKQRGRPRQAAPL